MSKVCFSQLIVYFLVFMTSLRKMDLNIFLQDNRSADRTRN